MENDYKAKLAGETLVAFFDSIGNNEDPYTKVVLEIFFEILIENKNDISIFSEKG